MQDTQGVTSIGAKLRQEIRLQAKGYHERRHYYWKRQACVLWAAVGLLLTWIIV